MLFFLTEISVFIFGDLEFILVFMMLLWLAFECVGALIWAWADVADIERSRGFGWADG